ncbi:MAG: glycosyltransferase family 9 protein [candidate division KSB1 bacterium]|nr:glycosyltransferase family 9 protein [candidate division KSB1 bacterium]MDZ7301477.1 glycosyltransferase family 9 protein [candidate division KSB1 bacterium]MDZ7310879.1 glycosyltransferase family 9 protein [candidate division KSB1 bacterium]
MKNLKKILVIKLRALGDVILATPVLENLRQAFPQAQIDFLTEKPCAPVVSGHPSIHEVLILDRQQSGASRWLIQQVRQRRYDAVFDLFGNPRSALFTWLSGAGIRVGFRFRGRKFAYNIKVTPRGDQVHEVDFNLDALRVLQIPIVTRKLHVAVDADSENSAAQFWQEHGLQDRLVIGLNASGGWYTKRWPLEAFAQLGDRLRRELNAVVLLLWGPGELDDVKLIAQMMQAPALLAPATNLKQLAALLARLTLLISNDSGPLHLAAARGTPVVGIYGPTRPDLQGPWGEGHEIVLKDGLPCLGCNGVTCKIVTHDCMKKLEVEVVWEAVLRSLRQRHETKNG